MNTHQPFFPRLAAEDQSRTALPQRGLRHGILCVAVLAAASGCAMFDAPVPPPQQISIRVEADPGVPVKGADLFFSGEKVSTTNDAGQGKLSLTGRDGETFDVVVKCPQGYASPTKPITVVIKRLADPKKHPEYFATCPPTTRLVVVAVRAEGGPNLPVMHLGREVARTDASGAAHVLLRLRPDEQFDLAIKTDEPGNERLRPKNPQEAFFMKSKDDVLTFDQKFTLEKPRAAPPRPGKPKPIRLD
jgi:hypothetical protein